MSLDIPIRKKRPPIRIGMLPSFIPVRLGEFRPCSIYRLHDAKIADAVVVRGYTHDRAIFLVQSDILLLEMTVADLVEVPEFSKSSPEGARDGAEGRG